MTGNNYTTAPQTNVNNCDNNAAGNENSRPKNAHLTFEERVIIETLKKEGYSNYRIAQRLGVKPGTVARELKRGTTHWYVQYKKGTRGARCSGYSAKKGQAEYQKRRQKCGRKCKLKQCWRFLTYVVGEFLTTKHSLDAIRGAALRSGLFDKKQVVCTRTLYKYVELGLIGIKIFELPEKLKRRTKRRFHAQEHKRKLGRSIDERDPLVDNLLEFGHWEVDLICGRQTGDDDFLMTLLEKKTRMLFIFRLQDKKASSVMSVWDNLKREYGREFNFYFKTVTTDNGSEFYRLGELETVGTKVYFAHPYCSSDKAQIERHNGLVRRFIPKGKRIDSFSDATICEIQDWCNSVPRACLDYATPKEMFAVNIQNPYFGAEFAIK